MRLPRVPIGFEPLESRFLLSADGAVARRFIKDIPYPSADGRVESLDVLLPAGQAPQGGWPVVVAIHGGGWRRFSKEEYEPTVAPLTQSGLAVVAIDYSLSSPGRSSWPAAIEDAKAAVSWVKTSGSALGLDPDRVAAMGESAGGNLAALLGTDPGGASSSVSAVVDFFGPSDLAQLDAQSPRARPAVEQFLGGTPEQVPALYAAASPVDHVAPGDPPFLIVQGSADPVVPEAQSMELASDLSDAGVPESLIVVPGAGHGFGLHVRGMDLESSVVDFLNAILASDS